MTIQEKFRAIRQEKGAGLFVLLDPDKHPLETLGERASAAEEAGADAILTGSSLLVSATFDDAVKVIKDATTLPVVIFPGNTGQISRHADAILFLSLVSGRNPETLIGQHVKAAPIVHAYGLEAIATGYLLIESGTLSSTEFMSDTKPIPRAKPDIALAHALAAKYLGMGMIYLEAGSGAKWPVPEEMITAVAKTVELPLIVGGGIRDTEAAEKAVVAGADFVVVGNALETTGSSNLLAELAQAVHGARQQ